MNSYKKGYRYERKTVQWLKERNYSVIRSAGSHGPWDVVAFRYDDTGLVVRLIQVKADCKPSQKEVRAMFHWPGLLDWKEVFIWTSGKKDPEIYSLMDIHLTKKGCP